MFCSGGRHRDLDGLTYNAPRSFLPAVVADPTKRAGPDSLFRSLLDAAPDSIIVVDESGKIAFASAQTRIMFGYGAEDLLGQSVEVLIPHRFRDSHIGHRRGFSRDNRVRPMGIGLELYGLRKDGSEFPVEISLSPLATEDGRLVLTAVRDICARKEMEAQLEVSRAQVASSARLSALGVMAGGIAHEINNPLGIIHAYASNLLEMARSGQLSAKDVEKAGTRIVETSERIGRIVESLRSIARDGSADLFHPAQVREIVAQAVELCHERFQMHSVRLEIPEIDARLNINCRQVQIAQVLLNLLQNAFDAVVEQAGEKWVAIDVHMDSESLCMSVIDTGPGIPAALRPRIMEPFFTTKPIGKGTGLGLSLSRSIAQQHGGELNLGERGGHTCFSLILPIAGVH